MVRLTEVNETMNTYKDKYKNKNLHTDFFSFKAFMVRIKMFYISQIISISNISKCGDEDLH